jgi:hypothetical protein
LLLLLFEELLTLCLAPPFVLNETKTKQNKPQSENKKNKKKQKNMQGEHNAAIFGEMCCTTLPITQQSSRSSGDPHAQTVMLTSWFRMGCCHMRLHY